MAPKHLRSAWQRVHKAARRQHGLFTYRQADSAGVDHHALTRAVDHGIIQRWNTGLYAFPGVPHSWEQRALAAQLTADALASTEDARGRRAVISHRSAAYLHGFLDVTTPNDIEMTVPRGTTVTSTDAVIHSSTTLEAEDRVRVGAFEVTTVERTLCDLGGTEEPRALLRMILDRWRRGRTTPQTVATCLARLGRVRGASTLRRILRELDPELAQVRSAEEGEAYLHLVRAGLPAPRVNHRVSVQGGRRRFLIDLCYPEHRLAMEVDGRLTHSLRYDRQHDAERQVLLEDEDWDFIRVTTADLAVDPGAFVAQVRAALELRRSM